jgi:hypothetical protein
MLDPHFCRPKGHFQDFTCKIAAPLQARIPAAGRLVAPHQPASSPGRPRQPRGTPPKRINALPHTPHKPDEHCPPGRYRGMPVSSPVSPVRTPRLCRYVPTAHLQPCTRLPAAAPDPPPAGTGLSSTVNFPARCLAFPRGYIRQPCTLRSISPPGASGSASPNPYTRGLTPGGRMYTRQRSPARVAAITRTGRSCRCRGARSPGCGEVPGMYRGSRWQSQPGRQSPGNRGSPAVIRLSLQPVAITRAVGGRGQRVVVR